MNRLSSKLECRRRSYTPDNATTGLVIRPPPGNLVYSDRQISADIVSVYFSASLSKRRIILETSMNFVEFGYIWILNVLDMNDCI